MVGALKNLTHEERERVSKALADAQSRTQARFAFVAVHASDRYHLYPVVWGALIAILSVGIMAVGVHYRLFPPLALSFVFLVQAAVFVVASLLLEWLPLRILVVPKHVKHAHARMLAHREFAVRILAHPERAGGILFFVSLAERHAEILVDHTLHAAAGQPVWDTIIADFTAKAARGHMADAVVVAANACGTILEQHRPKV